MLMGRVVYEVPREELIFQDTNTIIMQTIYQRDGLPYLRNDSLDGRAKRLEDVYSPVGSHVPFKRIRLDYPISRKRS